MSKFLEQNKLLFLVGFLCLLLYLPYLLNPHYSLLDDGQLVKKIQNTSLTEWANLIDPDFNRSTPFFWIFNSVIFRVSNYEIAGVIFFRFLELCIIAWLCFSIIRKLATPLSAFLGTAFILTTSALVTNFYEIGTYDHISVLLLLLFTFIYFRLIPMDIAHNKKAFFLLYTTSLLIMVSFFLTKETNFFLLFVFVGAMLCGFFEKNTKLIRLNASYALISCGILLFYFFSGSGVANTLNTDGYSIKNIIPSFLGYIKILNVSVGIITYLVVKLVCDAKTQGRSFIRNLGHEKIFLLCVTVLSFLVYLPWGGLADRYLFVSITFFYILFFSFFNLSKKRFFVFLLVLTFLGNLFFFSFHAVRFYGGRVGDDKLMVYLVSHATEYSQICVQGSISSAEDIAEINMWINNIHNLNKKICVLVDADDPYVKNHKRILDTEHVQYDDRFIVDSSTVVVVKDHSFVPALGIPKNYVYTIKEVLETHIPNIHPTRGFEIKKFDWKIGSVNHVPGVTQI